MLLLVSRRNPLNRIFIESKLCRINFFTLQEFGAFFFLGINKQPNIVVTPVYPLPYSLSSLLLHVLPFCFDALGMVDCFYVTFMYNR